MAEKFERDEDDQQRDGENAVEEQGRKVWRDEDADADSPDVEEQGRKVWRDEDADADSPDVEEQGIRPRF